jgi:ADP-heptose:LPS heptosyltransferase
LAWVVEGGAGELVEGHAALDQVIRIPRRWLKSPRAVRQLWQTLRRLQFDVAVDLQGLTKSALVARLSGAPRRLGAGGSDGRELSKWLNNELTLIRADHVVDHYLGILAPLGIRQPQVRFDVPEEPADAQFAASLLRDCGLQEGAFAVLNPGAGWPSKLWPAERYGELAWQLDRSWGLPSLAVWGGGEQGLARAIVESSGGKAVLAPATRLRQLGSVLRRARLFVGSDTGPMHLAAAVGTPTASLHGPSRAAWCGAYGPRNQRLQAYYHDGTARQRRSASNDAMRAISVEMALEACRRLLEETGVRASA